MKTKGTISKQIKNKIRKDLIRDIDYQLAEIDIDAMVDKFEINKEVKAFVRERINERITHLLHQSISRAVMKTQPLMDAFTDDHIRSIMIKFDSFLDKLNNENKKESQ